jgi:hypothetical protein
VFSSGCHSFWRNDLLKLIPHPSAGVILLGAMRTKESREIYGLRKQTVEPVFGITKEVLGFRRFLLRGHEKVSLEWELVSTSYNLKRLLKLGLSFKSATA